MKALTEAFATVILVSLCLVLAFLFVGEPDLWDALHNKAMQAANGIKEQP